jgi:hydroxyacyl-ACP dehydratase HTD2-like protein with hotdog domain
MLNPDLVGRTYTGANSVTVSQESITSFALAIGEPNVTVAPPTYSISLSLSESQTLLQESGLDWSRVVHGDQKFEIHRPLVAGDTVRCDSTIESIRVVAGNEIATVRSDLFAGDEIVISSWSTLVARA